MKTTKGSEEISDCFTMASRLAKLKCAVNSAYRDTQTRDGAAAKHQLRHAVAGAYEMGMLHPAKKAEFDAVAQELRHLSRYTKDKLSKNSAQMLRGKLTNLGERIHALKGDVKARCHVGPR